jgi:hypothetical protein
VFLEPGDEREHARFADELGGVRGELRGERPTRRRRQVGMEHRQEGGLRGGVQAPRGEVRLDDARAPPRGVLGVDADRPETARRSGWGSAVRAALRVFVSVSVSAFFFFFFFFAASPGPRRVERAVQDGVEGERLLAALERRLSRRLGLGLRARRLAPP